MIKLVFLVEITHGWPITSLCSLSCFIYFAPSSIFLPMVGVKESCIGGEGREDGGCTNELLDALVDFYEYTPPIMENNSRRHSYFRIYLICKKIEAFDNTKK